MNTFETASFSLPDEFNMVQERVMPGISRLSVRRLAMLLLFLCTFAARGFLFGQPTPDPVGEKLEAVYEEGRALFNAQKPDDALKIWEEGLRAAEEQKRRDYVGKMHLGLAIYYALAKNDPVKGEEECKVALKLNPGLSQAHALLGRIYFDAQKMADAERELKAGLEFERWKDQTLIRLETIYRLTGRKDEALTAARQCEEWLAKAGQPPDENAYAVLGVEYGLLDKPEEAERCFKRSLEIKPSWSAYVLYGDFLKDAKRYPEAEKAYREGLKAATEENAPIEVKAEVLPKIGIVCIERKSYKRAITALREAEKLVPNYTDIQIGLYYSLLNNGQAEEAEASLKRLLTLQQPFRGYKLLADFFCDHEGYAEAERLYKKALAAVDPGKTDLAEQCKTLWTLARICGLRDASDEALKYIQDLVKLVPEDKPAQAALGYLLENLKQFEKAEAAYRCAVEGDAWRQGCLWYGEFLMNQNRCDEAAPMFRKALDIQADDFTTTLRLAAALQCAGKHADALAALREAEKLLRNNQEVYWRLGMSLSATGKAEEADAAFKQAFEIKPTQQGCYQYAMFLKAQEKLKDAEEYFRKALQFEPDNSDVLRELADTLEKLDRYEESIEMAQKALDLKEKAGEDYQRELGVIALCYKDIGRQEEAIMIFEKLLAAASGEKKALKEAWCLHWIGDLYFNESKYLDAIDAYEQMLGKRYEVTQELWKGLSEDSKSLFVLVRGDLGNAARMLNRYDRAIQYYTEGLEAAKTLGTPKLRNGVLRELYSGLGDVYYDKNDNLQAIDAYKQALRIAEENNLVTAQLEVISSLVYPLRDSGAFEEGDRYETIFVKLLAGLKEEEQPLYEAAQLYTFLGDYEKAFEYCKREVDVWRRLGRMRGLAQALAAFGDALVSLGRYNDALSAYRESITLSEKLPYPYEKAYNYSQIGSVQQSLGNHQEARKAFQKALSEYETIQQPREVANTLVDIAFLDLDLGNYEAALASVQNAQKKFQEQGDLLNEARQLHNQGSIYEAQKDYQRALETFKRALELKRNSGDVVHTFTTLDSIGRQHMYLGNLPEAEKKMLEALDLAKKGKMKQGILDVEKSLGELRIKQGRNAEAKKLLLKVTTDDARTGAPSNNDAWYLLGIAQRNLGEKGEAITSLRQSIDIIERMRRAAVGKLGETQFLERYRDVYQALIGLLIEIGNLNDAYSYIEMEKITEFQQANPDRSFGDPEQEEAYRKGRGYRFREAALDKEIRDATSKPVPDKTFIENLRKLRNEVQNEFSMFLGSLEGTKFKGVREQLPINPRQFSKYVSKGNVPEGVFIIQPLLLHEQKEIAILVFSKSGSFKRLVRIASEDEITKLMGQLINGLVTPKSSEAEIKNVAGQLYDLLIAPIEEDIRGAKLLVVSAAGRLRKIPFQALYDRQNGQYLIEKMPIMVNLTAPSLEQPTPLPNEPRIFAVANPDDSLDAADKQMAELKKLFPYAEIYDHDRATAEALNWESNGGKKYDILVFATHAYVLEDHPENSYILLAKNERLTYRNLPGYQRSWQPDLQLVVLSVCNAAVTVTTEDFSMHGLAGQFDDAGIRYVTASLWKVADQSTAELMTRFFANMKKQLPLPEALQQAQVDILKMPLYTHPYFWAPFVLIGDWR